MQQHDDMLALLAAMGHSEVRTVVDNERTVYVHVFSPPTGSIGFDPNILHVKLDLQSGKLINATYTLRNTHGFEKIVALSRRMWRWKKIRRRQKRAEQRRMRKGLA